MKTIITIIFTLFFASCSCNYHLEKAQKKCGKLILTDTIIVHDTIRIHSSSKDTIFHWTKTSDTVRINNERLHIKYFYNIHDSLVYLSGKCDTIKVYKIIKVPVEKEVLEFNWLFWFKKNIIWILIILGIIVLIKYLIRK